MRIEGRKLGRGRTWIHLIGRGSLGVSGAVGIGMQMGDETSVGKSRAYINRERKIRIRRARFPVVEETTCAYRRRYRRQSSTKGPLDKGVYLEPQGNCNITSFLFLTFSRSFFLFSFSLLVRWKRSIYREMKRVHLSDCI